MSCSGNKSRNDPKKSPKSEVVHITRFNLEIVNVRLNYKKSWVLSALEAILLLNLFCPSVLATLTTLYH